MIIFRNPLAFATVFPIMVIIFAFLHIYYPKLYSKWYMFKHSLASIVLKKIKKSGGRGKRSLSLALKLAIAFLISLAFAQPYIVSEQVVYIESRELSELRFEAKPALVIILDSSGSMYGEKIETAKKVIKNFIENLNLSIDIGFIDFDHSVKQAIAPTDNWEKVVEAVEKAQALGGTMYSYPLKVALNWLTPYREMNISVAIVFTSDGLPADIKEYRELLKEFKDREIPIYTVFIGYENEGVEEMKMIAKETGGKSFVAQTARELPEALGEALKGAVQAIQKIEVETKITKKVEIYTPLTGYILIAMLVLYVMQRFIVYRFSGVTF